MLIQHDTIGPGKDWKQLLATCDLDLVGVKLEASRAHRAGDGSCRKTAGDEQALDVHLHVVVMQVTEQTESE